MGEHVVGERDDIAATPENRKVERNSPNSRKDRRIAG
jgi:hypothetical protein